MRLKVLPLILLLLSTANALTININSPQNQVGSDDDLTVDYEIDLNKEELTNYVISLINDYNEFIILNQTQNIKSVSESIIYDMSEVASGNYFLSLSITNPSLTTTQLSIDNISVLRELDLRIIMPDQLYVQGDSETIDALLINDGNTDLLISAFFKNALSDITISPQSFSFDRQTSKELSITFTKPETDYNATLVILAIADDEETTTKHEITIILPIINLTIGEVNVQKTSNETSINTEISNNGNIDINATIKLRTFALLEGFITTEELVTVSGGELINYSSTMPSKEIVSFQVTYTREGEQVVIKKELSILDRVPFDFKLSKERLMLLGALIGILVLVIYFKSRRKKRP